MQLYIDIVDYDTFKEDDLIDRFAINLIDANNFSSGEVYTGVFGFAEIELSFERVCAENFYGPRCEVFCVENCVFDCERANCNNGTCIQGIASITCACEPGFTGTDCSTNINECEGSGVNCYHGICMDGIASFTCMCEPEFTGEFCKTQVSDQLLIPAIAAPVSAVCFCLLIVAVVVLVGPYLRRRNDKRRLSNTDEIQLAVRPTTAGNHEGSNVTTREGASTIASALIIDNVSSLLTLCPA